MVPVIYSLTCPIYTIWLYGTVKVLLPPEVRLTWPGRGVQKVWPLTRDLLLHAKSPAA